METKSSGLFGGMTLQPQQPVSQSAPLQPAAPQPAVSQPAAPQPSSANNDFADSFGLLELDTQPQTTVC